MKLKKRNLSSTDVILVEAEQVIWTNWTVEKAVKEGYKSSGWVYKAVSLISQNAASAPFVVKNKENEIEWGHPLTNLLLNPHPYLSRVQFYELLVQWLQLAGNAYLKKANNSVRQTLELWPISPDRIRPIESIDNSNYVDGYEIKNQLGVWGKDPDFDSENVIHIALTNAAQPLNGISPLQSVAKTVDADIAQQSWNTATMQNRGVVDGVFTFKEHLDKVQSDTILKRISDKFSGILNARKPLIIGSNAAYTRMSLTAAEMDFLESRKFNRDEIFSVFGVPPQLGGSQEASTYNNFATSMRIFWEATLIPLLTLLATQFTLSFKDQLGTGYYVSVDLTGISALKENDAEIATTAKLYSDMGVPFERINEKFDLGISEYDGWDKPHTTASITEPEENRGLLLIPNEKRDAKKEAARRDHIAEGPAAKAYTDLLDAQRNAVYTALKAGEDPIPAVRSFNEEFITVTTNLVASVAADFANTVVVDTRGNKLNFERRGAVENALIKEFLLEENYILSEVSEIQDHTIKIILEQVSNSSEKGFNYEELRKALDDTGIFSAERALRIARTETGTAASVGQLAGAKVAGADFKIWQTAGTETRDAHIARQGEKVNIDNRFSKQISAVGPRFPLDNRISAADRINCNCFMTFEVN
jgi:HK97 family phage portal protein